jgi:hypothetical protein
MHPDWPKKIGEAQRRTHYIIFGHSVTRIGYGDEPDDWGTDRVSRLSRDKGSLSRRTSLRRRALPELWRQVISCDCEYEGDEADQ